MDHEIPLPPPPRIRHRDPSNNNNNRHATRPAHHHRLPSRFIDDRSSQPSSDPALFSSDDIPASGLENYNNAPVSRKRRYRGTWWGEMVKDKDAKRKRADFKEKRLVDSGVWMGSDDYDSGPGSGFLPSDADLGEDWLNSHANGGSKTVTPQTQSQQQGFRKVEEEPREHQVARGIVNDCLERGEDSVDLSGLTLRLIPPNLLLPLQHLTKLPTIREPPISEDVYTSLQPFLRLFLAGNALTQVPGEIFDLDSLRVLSLRYNKLTSIPPAIRSLTLLQELNISVNRLPTLPWELLFLIRKGDLKHLTVRPNPLLQIEDQPIAQWHVPTDQETQEPQLKSVTYDGPPPEEAWAPVHVATGPVTYYNAEGVPVSSQIPTEQTNHQTITTTTSSSSISRVPSLREISLLAFTRSTYPDLITDEEMEDFPALMTRLLRQAKEVRSAGGRNCSSCHRGFVLARTEWIEWWDVSTYENGLKGPRASGEVLRPLPFRRVGCSWGCVPEVV
ncbi:hypothetical protein CBS147320_497 [Aspergillus niger]|uniref:leucine-rich repeat domain-containing protein n=1 Tax=Aspergillus lacticoffeatus (strain CBS 101883) TaxID=1450533 RepID=UPI000D7FB09C|nr:leucine rich repeat domain protein [Aspergillus niger CBS 101883]KAI2850344.1 hypothetical protein CBS11350_1646 [Aspergillus niger]KAI2889991.1 hypothetical protein CBS11852_6603 [Aspergillus niger]KAI2935490.1 hypothetical protein CBS147320_497 [Aspergillus niger]PYH57587.1 leucine rich repeat domain protein [Aspergillus niger CBS 101883]GJP92368.1 leucine rich repeat domain protein [Aspergillus niger]